MAARTVPLLAALALSACSQADAPEAAVGAAQGDNDLRAAFAPYLGVWEREDGAMRRVFLEEAGADGVVACLRMPDDAGAWRTVARGVFSRTSEEGAPELRVEAEFSGAPAAGFERLEIRGYAVAGGGMDLTSLTVSADAETLSYETWSAPAGGAFDYVVERPGAPEGFEGGRWIFNGAVEPDCS